MIGPCRGRCPDPVSPAAQRLRFRRNRENQAPRGDGTWFPQARPAHASVLGFWVTEEQQDGVSVYGRMNSSAMTDL